MSISDDFSALAQDLMQNEFGITATLTRVTSVYDPATDTATKTDVNVSAFVVLGTRKRKNDNGVSVTETTLKSNVALMAGDRVTLQAKVYRVITVEEIAPHGVAIFWTAVVSA